MTYTAEGRPNVLRYDVTGNIGHEDNKINTEKHAKRWKKKRRNVKESME